MFILILQSKFVLIKVVLSQSLWAAFYCTKRAVKQVIHKLESEALPRSLKSSLCMFQCIFRLILFICIAIRIMPMIQPYSYKTLPPSLVKVVALNTNDKVV